jgi:fumarate reductase subunit D
MVLNTIECNKDFSQFAKEYNLFCRYKANYELMTDLDIFLTKIFLILMTVAPIYITIYKIDHYEEDKKYCDTHQNVHSCRNVSFPYCIMDIIINVISIKIMLELILGRITNTFNFVYKNGNRVMDYIDDDDTDTDSPTPKSLAINVMPKENSK